MTPWLALPIACAAFVCGVVVVLEIDRRIISRFAERSQPSSYCTESGGR
jgi:hypothetical protein